MVELSSKQIDDIWIKSNDPKIFFHSVSWPDLEKFVGSCHEVYGFSNKSDLLSNLAKQGFNIYKNLTFAPIESTNPINNLSQLIQDCKDFIDSRSEYSAIDSVYKLLSNALVLEKESSLIAVAVLDKELSRYGVFDQGILENQPEAAVVILVPELVEATKASLQEQEYEAIVCTPSQLRNYYRFKAIIIVGDISNAFTSYWMDKQTAAKTYGWLFTSSIADEVIAVSAFGSKLDLDSYWLLPNQFHPNLHPTYRPSSSINFSTADRSFQEKISSLSIHVPNDNYFSQTPPSITDISAFRYLLCSGREVYFDNFQGPVPRVISIEESFIDIKKRNSKDIYKGDILLLQTKSSPHLEIEKRAGEILQNKGWSKDEIASTLKAQKCLKNSLQTALGVIGENRLSQLLQNKGISKQYSIYLCRAPLKQDYIAPNELGFKFLIEVIGPPELLRSQHSLEQLRQAHKEAGKQIKKDIIDYLSKDLNWIDQLFATGFIEIKTSNLGNLLIEIVSQNRTDLQYRVTKTYLGKALEKGKPFLGKSRQGIDDARV